MPEQDTQLIDIGRLCEETGRQTKSASRQLAQVSTELKNQWLLHAANALTNESSQILAANAGDLERAADYGLTKAEIDRLTLTPERIAAMSDGLGLVAQLPDPVGRELTCTKRPNGLEIRKIRVPLGVILFIYESRPNVTADAAALAVKSGNAIILRGGKEALATNRAIHLILEQSLDAIGLPSKAVQLVKTPNRTAVDRLLALDKHIDLVIPRGGEALIRRVAEKARMPVLKHYKGNCHVYVDREADLDMAERIVVNAKCQRPGVCNAAESLLVHRAVVAQFLPRVVAALRNRGVRLYGCQETLKVIPDTEPATDTDYETEYLDLALSVKVVDTLVDAVTHINHYGSQHTDAIVTRNEESARQFTTGVDSAVVMVNASTRFNDGYEFGLGAEIGISTDKLHARGPCGLEELTTYKYVVTGAGHTRS